MHHFLICGHMTCLEQIEMSHPAILVFYGVLWEPHRCAHIHVLACHFNCPWVQKTSPFFFEKAQHSWTFNGAKQFCFVFLLLCVSHAPLFLPR